ncbi:MAG TPA: hypothetical protein VFK20_11595 [Vicinamibacterales bacterium]|nr:hypothetical protein [Vicinamibacterales bacterium]
MSIRTFAVASFTTEAVADTTNMTDNAHMNLQGGSSTQRTKIVEVYAGGLEASTSSPQKLLLARDSTIGATLTSLTTGQSDTPDDPATAALSAPVVPFTASTTKCQRAKAYLANLAFNAIGGIVRLRFPEGQEPTMLGNTASNGEVSLSGFTGTTAALIGAHIKYETLVMLLAVGLSAWV